MNDGDLERKKTNQTKKRFPTHYRRFYEKKLFKNQHNHHHMINSSSSLLFSFHFALVLFLFPCVCFLRNSQYFCLLEKPTNTNTTKTFLFFLFVLSLAQNNIRSFVLFLLLGKYYYLLFYIKTKTRKIAIRYSNQYEQQYPGSTEKCRNLIEINIRKQSDFCEKHVDSDIDVYIKLLLMTTTDFYCLEVWSILLSSV